MKNIGDSWARGTGVFETIRVEDNQVFALHRHHCRAKEAAEDLGFQIPAENEVSDESYQIINSCDYPLGRLRWHFDKDGEFTISYVPFVDPTTPARLIVIDQRSNNYEIRKKVYPYRNLAILEQIQKLGYDDGIILTDDGQVSESAVATLLLKIEGHWVTPPLSSGILNGVVRALVLEAGLSQVRRIDEKELQLVESGLLLTSLRNAQHIGSINARNLELDERMRLQIHTLMGDYKGR